MHLYSYGRRLDKFYHPHGSVLLILRNLQIGQKLLNVTVPSHIFLLLISQLPWSDVLLLPNFSFLISSLIDFFHFLLFISQNFKAFYLKCLSHPFFCLLSFSASCIFYFLKICALPVVLTLSSCTLLFGGILLLCGSRWAGESRFCFISPFPLVIFLAYFHLPRLASLILYLSLSRYIWSLKNMLFSFPVI